MGGRLDEAREGGRQSGFEWRLWEGKDIFAYTPEFWAF